MISYNKKPARLYMEAKNNRKVGTNAVIENPRKFPKVAFKLKNNMLRKSSEEHFRQDCGEATGLQKGKNKMLMKGKDQFISNNQDPEAKGYKGMMLHFASQSTNCYFELLMFLLIFAFVVGRFGCLPKIWLKNY